MSQVDLSVVVLHYNRWDLTKDCLASIDAQEIPCSYEKVIIDNGSTMEEWTPPPGWRKVYLPKNLGHIAGQNKCFEHAQGKWVLFVANDVRLLEESVKVLWNEIEDIKQPSLFTPQRDLDNRGLLWIWPGYGVSTSCIGGGTLTFTFAGSCYLMKKSTWEAVGGFDEHLLTSHEDIEFSLRAIRMGYTIGSTAFSRAIHLGNATLRHSPSHTRAAFHRDRLYVLRKHYHGLDYWLRYLTVQLLDHLPRL